MIKINLLGKKKVKAPFGLDEVMEKYGINQDQLVELRPILLKAAVILGGLYIANYIPNEMLVREMIELDAQIEVVNQQTQALQKELNEKKDIRKQMEQLNKEEVELQRQLNAVNSLSKDRSLAFKTLDALVSTLPNNVWLSKIEYNDRKVLMEGSSWEYFPINDYVKVLTENTLLQNVMFKGITTETPRQLIQGVPAAAQKIKNFQLELNSKGSS